MRVLIWKTETRRFKKRTSPLGPGREPTGPFCPFGGAAKHKSRSNHHIHYPDANYKKAREKHQKNWISSMVPEI